MEKNINIETKLQEPVNFTDPYVLHDVQMGKPVIVQLYQPGDISTENGKDKNGNNRDSSSIKTDGILYPLIQLNTKSISYDQIVEMIINYDHFLPTIKLTIKDINKSIKHMDIPGLNNTLKVIIIPEVNNIYKSISLNFTILSVKSNGDNLTYYGKYKILEFNKKRIKELIYRGCSNTKGKSDKNSDTVKCNPSENKRPNTWELLHIIANECKLGFSSTDECQNIKDNLPRLIYNKNYEDFIEEQLAFGGLDENSVFDAWVDLYGYLVMVNVSWVLNNETVTPSNLGIYSFVGIHGTDEINSDDTSPILVHRTLTNYIGSGKQNNLFFQNFDFIINNSDLRFGTSVSMYNFELLDIKGGNNSINQYDIEVIQDSVDALAVEEYEVQSQERLVIECNDLPINKQKLVRQKFFSKHRQRILEIEMDKINLGLQRGTLVNVIIFESEPKNKRKILDQMENSVQSEISDLDKESISPNEELLNDGNNKIDPTDMTVDEKTQIFNPSLSGMYYIDGMRFEYRYQENIIKQFVQLIKKSNLNNINNLHTLPKMNVNI